MTRIAMLLLALAGTLTVLAGCQEHPHPKPAAAQQVQLCDLLANPATYNGKTVRVTALVGIRADGYPVIDGDCEAMNQCMVWGISSASGSEAHFAAFESEFKSRFDTFDPAGFVDLAYATVELVGMVDTGPANRTDRIDETRARIRPSDYRIIEFLENSQRKSVCGHLVGEGKSQCGPPCDPETGAGCVDAACELGSPE